MTCLVKDFHDKVQFFQDEIELDGCIPAGEKKMSCSKYHERYKNDV